MQGWKKKEKAWKVTRTFQRRRRQRSKVGQKVSCHLAESVWMHLFASPCYEASGGTLHPWSWIWLSAWWAEPAHLRSRTIEREKRSKQTKWWRQDRIDWILCRKTRTAPPLMERLTQSCISLVLDCTSAGEEASGAVPLRGGFTELHRGSTTQRVAVFRV